MSQVQEANATDGPRTGSIPRGTPGELVVGDATRQIIYTEAIDAAGGSGSSSGRARASLGAGTSANGSAGQAQGSKQVFDVREEPGKARECVLIWDEGTQVSLCTRSCLGGLENRQIMV